MSVCGPTEEDGAAEEMGAPVRDIYEQKAVSKVVRVLTVLAYLLSVSLAAILLSVYYICVWKSPELPPADAAELSARRAEPHAHLVAHALLDAGGSNTTVSGNVTQFISNITEVFSNATDSDSTAGPEAPGAPEDAAPAFPDAADGSGDDNGVT